MSPSPPDRLLFRSVLAVSDCVDFLLSLSSSPYPLSTVFDELTCLLHDARRKTERTRAGLKWQEQDGKATEPQTPHRKHSSCDITRTLSHASALTDAVGAVKWRSVHEHHLPLHQMLHPLFSSGSIESTVRLCTRSRFIMRKTDLCLPMKPNCFITAGSSSARRGGLWQEEAVCLVCMGRVFEVCRWTRLGWGSWA